MRNAILHACDSETGRFYRRCDVFKQDGPTIWTYVVVSVPVIDDRDHVLVRTIEEELAADGSGRFRLSYTNDERIGPPPSGKYVRLQVIEGEWIVEPFDDGRRSRVRYHLHCEGGGWVPSWIPPLAARQTLPEYLRTVERAALRVERQRGPALAAETGWQGVPIAAR